MSCGCNQRERKATDYDECRAMALKLSKLDKTDYVIYEQEEKTYWERKECWIAAGRPGELAEIICHY